MLTWTHRAPFIPFYVPQPFAPELLAPAPSTTYVYFADSATIADGGFGIGFGSDSAAVAENDLAATIIVDTASGNDGEIGWPWDADLGLDPLPGGGGSGSDPSAGNKLYDFLVAPFDDDQPSESEGGFAAGLIGDLAAETTATCRPVSAAIPEPRPRTNWSRSQTRRSIRPIKPWSTRRSWQATSTTTRRPAPRRPGKPPWTANPAVRPTGRSRIYWATTSGPKRTPHSWRRLPASSSHRRIVAQSLEAALIQPLGSDGSSGADPGGGGFNSVVFAATFLEADAAAFIDGWLAELLGTDSGLGDDLGAAGLTATTAITYTRTPAAGRSITTSRSRPSTDSR